MLSWASHELIGVMFYFCKISVLDFFFFDHPVKLEVKLTD